MQNHF